MKFQPIGDKVLIAPTVIEKEEKKSSLIIVDAENKGPIHGEVVAIGDEVKEGRFSVGDLIQFEIYSGKNVDVLGNKFILVPTDKIEGKMFE